jgi:hypothetical protein
MGRGTYLTRRRHPHPERARWSDMAGVSENDVQCVLAEIDVSVMRFAQRSLNLSV